MAIPLHSKWVRVRTRSLSEMHRCEPLLRFIRGSKKANRKVLYYAKRMFHFRDGDTKICRKIFFLSLTSVWKNDAEMTPAITGCSPSPSSLSYTFCTERVSEIQCLIFIRMIGFLKDHHIVCSSFMKICIILRRPVFMCQCPSDIFCCILFLPGSPHTPLLPPPDPSRYSNPGTYKASP